MTPTNPPDFREDAKKYAKRFIITIPLDDRERGINLEIIETISKHFSEGATHGYALSRKEALEKINAWFADYCQGTVELVNMGDATMADIYPKLKELEYMQRELNKCVSAETQEQGK